MEERHRLKKRYYRNGKRKKRMKEMAGKEEMDKEKEYMTGMTREENERDG